MIRNSVTGTISLALMLQMVVQPATGEDQANAPYHYSDEWSVVSAPPPSGPYRSVNIDPRVPGAGSVSVIPMPAITPQAGVTEEQATATGLAEEELAPASAGEQALEAAAPLSIETSQPPPAAGIPALAPQPAAPAGAAAEALQRETTPPPAPGYYGHVMPPRTAYTRPAPAQYPYRAGYPGYRNMPPFGYYSAPAYQQQEEVPPPPQYERYRGYGHPR